MLLYANINVYFLDLMLAFCLSRENLRLLQNYLFITLSCPNMVIQLTPPRTRCSVYGYGRLPADDLGT